MRSTEHYALRDVTIVGMRFYNGALRYIHEAAKKGRCEDQCLFLVAESNNPKDANAVMLHNGHQKLGSVSATEAPAIRRILAEWRSKSETDDVIVCSIDRIAMPANDFDFVGSIKVHGHFRVKERFARKFADTFWKERNHG